MLEVRGSMLGQYCDERFEVAQPARDVLSHIEVIHERRSRLPVSVVEPQSSNI